MLNFQHEAPPDLGRSGFRLVRCPTARPLLAHVLSDRLMGTATHFVGNRTIPCETPNCEPCQSGVPWRWHGYVAVVLDATQEIVVFECTAKASAAFTEYYERMGTCRGAHMKAARINGKHNGRVLIQCKPADLAKVKLPDAPPVEKILAHIWGISENQVDQPAAMSRPPHGTIQVDTTKPELDPERSPAVGAFALSRHPQLAAVAGNGKPARSKAAPKR